LIRFHDLRHTTGSLLMMAGVNPATVQRILRHHDPRITTEIYGHLEPDYARAGELTALEWGDVDLEHGILHIHGSTDRAREHTKATKNGHGATSSSRTGSSAPPQGAPRGSEGSWLEPERRCLPHALDLTRPPKNERDAAMA
jgi:integrase